MKRFLTLTLSLVLALSLSACKAKEETPPPVQSAPAASEGTTEQKAEKIPELTELSPVSSSAEKAEGRAPVEDYKLPEKAVDMTVWMYKGGVGLLAEVEEADAAFYAIEGKEFSPALIRWGESMAEFDWAYITPRAFLPKLWCFDFDGDGEDELVVDCYYASGTGVSMSDLYVVEKEEDGTLSAVTFPAKELESALGKGLQLFEKEGRTYAALGTITVDVTATLEGLDFTPLGSGVTVGSVRSFELQGEGMKCILGVMLDASDAHFYYVAEITADVLYKDGEFILDGFHLEGY
ncbi:MAG: hypothetical protein IJF36_04305 [Oscillibacter sp.]|nr:hypothetical protein [Oscillibacter sp.]